MCLRGLGGRRVGSVGLIVDLYDQLKGLIAEVYRYYLHTLFP